MRVNGDMGTAHVRPPPAILLPLAPASWIGPPSAAALAHAGPGRSLRHPTPVGRRAVPPGPEPGDGAAVRLGLRPGRIDGPRPGRHHRSYRCNSSQISAGGLANSACCRLRFTANGLTFGSWPFLVTLSEPPVRSPLLHAPRQPRAPLQWSATP
jgi:hypothetical protein